jgi:acyl carrier protein
MDQIASRTVAIFKARADSALEPALETRLPDLEIEAPDLALILLDLEDAFGIDLPYDPDDEADTFKTVGDVVERARALHEAKRSPPAELAASLTRPKSLWLTARSRA